MIDNNQFDVNSKGTIFTVKNIIRMLAILCIIFVFCPSFLVSCQGEKKAISAMTVVGGVSSNGDKIEEAHPIFLICLLIPIFVLILLSIKKFTENKTALIITICEVVDIIVWLILRTGVKDVANENGWEFETTPWYACNMISMLIIILLTVYILITKKEMDSNLATIFSNGQGNVPNKGGAGHLPPGKRNICVKCGALIDGDSKYCTKCGTPVQELPLERIKTGSCVNCGAPLDGDSRFCTKCGTPVEPPVTPPQVIGKCCVNCGAPLDGDSKFCTKCGTPVEPPVTPPSPVISPLSVTPPSPVIPPPSVTPPPHLPLPPSRYSNLSNEELRNLVNNKDGEAMGELGERCLYGTKGHEKNLTRAYQLFHKGEKLENPRAYIGLGEMYRKGIRFAQNEELAREYYKKANQPYPEGD